MGIEYLLPDSIDDLRGQHFMVYNPRHRKSDDWHYEYCDLDEIIKDGFSIKEVQQMIDNGYVRICLEICEVEE